MGTGCGLRCFACDSMRGGAETWSVTRPGRAGLVTDQDYRPSGGSVKSPPEGVVAQLGNAATTPAAPLDPTIFPPGAYPTMRAEATTACP